MVECSCIALCSGFGHFGVLYKEDCLWSCLESDCIVMAHVCTVSLLTAWSTRGVRGRAWANEGPKHSSNTFVFLPKNFVFLPQCVTFIPCNCFPGAGMI